MFSAVRIGTGELDVGAVAEAMIYYGRVTLFARAGHVAELVHKLGYDSVVAALDLGTLELAFERTGYGVITNKRGQNDYHDMGNFSLTGTHDGQKIENIADELDYQFRRKFGRSSNSTKRAHLLAERIRETPPEGSILQQARKDIKDSFFVDAAIRDWLAAMAPEYLVPKDLHVEFVNVKNELLYLGRLDFEAINKIYHLHTPISHSSVTPAYLLSQFLEARKELSLAAASNADLWIGDGLSAILKQRVSTLISATENRKRDVNYFHDIEFEGRTFREVINSGEKSGADLIALLQNEQTQKFKTWLGAQDASGHLIKEYDKAVFKNHGWTQKLPFKLGKITAFAGLGALVDLGLGTMGMASVAAATLSAGSDVAVSSADEFLLSKILKGWKPNQFIDGPAKHFLAKNS